MDRHEDQYVFKVDNYGRPTGSEAGRFFQDLKDYYRNGYVKVMLVGFPQTPEALRGWYWSGILTTILYCMKQHGQPAIDPKSPKLQKQLHEDLKKMFLEPKTKPGPAGKMIYDLDDDGNYKYTTTGLGFPGWRDYVEKIVDMTYQEYGVVLKPKKSNNYGKG